MPIEYTPSKVAQQKPGVPATNGATILDATDFNEVNAGIVQVTNFANTLETSIEGKADTTDIPDVSGFQTAEQVNTAITAATSSLASQGDLDALEALVGDKADTSELANYATTASLADATDATQSGAAKVGAFLDSAETTVQAALEDILTRLAALESA